MKSISAERAYSSLDKKLALSQQDCVVTNKNTYGHLVDMLDVIRIKKIIADVSGIQQNDGLIPALSHFKILNLKIFK